MPACDLCLEVESGVAGVDLPASKGVRVRLADVEARLARHGNGETRIANEPTLAFSEEPGRIGEGRDDSAQPSLELGFRLGDLVTRSPLVEQEEVRMRHGVRLESEPPGPIEVDDFVPSENRGLRPVPAEPSPTVGNGGRDEDRRPEAQLLDGRKCVLGNVAKGVVEGEPDGPAREITADERVVHLGHSQNPVATLREDFHLLAEPRRPDSELVAVVGYAVIQEDADSRVGQGRPRPPHPERGPTPCKGGLERVNDG